MDGAKMTGIVESAEWVVKPDEPHGYMIYTVAVPRVKCVDENFVGHMAELIKRRPKTEGESK